jgi:hypothetical protein
VRNISSSSLPSEALTASSDSGISALPGPGFGDFGASSTQGAAARWPSGGAAPSRSLQQDHAHLEQPTRPMGGSCGGSIRPRIVSGVRAVPSARRGKKSRGGDSAAPCSSTVSQDPVNPSAALLPATLLAAALPAALLAAALLASALLVAIRRKTLLCCEKPSPQGNRGACYEVKQETFRRLSAYGEILRWGVGARVVPQRS